MAVEGVEAAIERAGLYRAAGADVLFVEAPRTRDDLARIASALGAGRSAAGEHGRGRQDAAPARGRAGGDRLRLVIFPGGIVRALARTAGEYYASLAGQGTTEPFRSRMLDLDGLNTLIGTPEMVALGKRYETAVGPAGKSTDVRR